MIFLRLASEDTPGVTSRGAHEPHAQNPEGLTNQARSTSTHVHDDLAQTSGMLAHQNGCDLAAC